MAWKTVTASPKLKGIVERRGGKGALAAKAAYLMRDTMKAVGYSDDFPRPLCALFFVDLTDPLAGGTGHTIRVCKQAGIPCAFQDSWEGWTLTGYRAE